MVFHYHKPLTGMYGDNYRYGTSLYSSSVGDVEKNYRTTLSKTNLRSDRGDLGLYTFAGSNLHGGAPATEKLSAPRTRSGSGSSPRSVNYNQDLYAPINTSEYGKGYYDHLRATSPAPRSRPKPEHYYDLQLDGSDYKAPVPTRISNSDFDDHGTRKVTKKTTTTEHWVPLTTHFYHTPYHSYYYSSSPYSSYTYRTADDLYSYNYLDDYKRYSTYTTTSKNVDALDLSVSKNFETSQYSEKCRQLQSQLDEVSKWVSEAESKLKSEVVSSRSKMQSELQEVSLVVEDTLKYNDDLHRVIKKQAKQIAQLGSQYDEINRHLVDISDTIEKSRVRCQSLQSELSTVSSAIEMSMKRRF